MEQSLPPYLRHDELGQPDQPPWQADFSCFECHRSLPFALSRDFYQSGEFGGEFHHNNFLALYVVRGGQGIHHIGKRPYGLVRGDVYLMASGETHEFTQFANLEIDCFFFQVELFSAEELAALREMSGFWRLFAGDGETQHRIHLAPEEWQSVDAKIESMRNHWGDGSRAGALLLQHEFFIFLVSLARRLEKVGQAHAACEAGRDSGIFEALRFCEENFDKPLSVTHLAARAMLSPGHFSELFSQEVGMPPGAYVRRIRLEKARAMLRETSEPVAEIAARCGFGSAALFSRAFHNCYQAAPLQYRKQEK